MKQYIVPLFVPFNVRNQIINENHPTRKLDICEIKPQDQVQVLLSYLKEKQINKALKKANFDNIFRDRKNYIYQMDLQRGFFQNRLNYKNHDSIREKLDLFDLGFVGNIETKISGASLKAYWRFNETSGNIINQAGNVTGNASLGSAADGTASNLTYNQATGPFNYSGEFIQANSSKVTVGSSVSQFDYMHQSGAIWTLAFWLRKNVATGNTNNSIFSDHDGYETAINVGAGVYIDSGTAMFANVTNATQVILTFTQGTIAVPDTTNWHFYCMTVDLTLANQNGKYRRDNANLVTADKTANTPSVADATGAALIGQSTQGNHWLAGYLAEISNWNRILTSVEQSFIYSNGAGKTLY